MPIPPEVFEAVARRSLLSSLTGLAELKARALRDLEAGHETEPMRKAFALLRLVREMRKDRIREYRRGVSRYRRQAEEHAAEGAYWTRLRAGLTTEEERASHRRATMARLQAQLAETKQMLAELGDKLDEVRALSEKRKTRRN